MIKDGENGYLIPCYDKEKYIEVICQCLCDDNEKRFSMRKKSRDIIVSWDNDRIVKLWNDIFAEIEKEE